LLEQLKWKVKVVTIEDFSKHLFLKYSKAPDFQYRLQLIHNYLTNVLVPPNPSHRPINNETLQLKCETEELQLVEAKNVFKQIDA